MPSADKISTNKSTSRLVEFFRAPKVVRRFAKKDDGATVIEFAMLAGPFFLLLMAIIESSLLFFAGQLLESSVDDVARKVRTGQLKDVASAAAFRTEVCKDVKVLFDCNDLNIDMQVVATYADLGDMPGPADGEIDPDDFSYTQAGPKQIVMITVVTEWPVFTNYFQSALSDLDNNNAVLTAVAAFKTEPFS